jgi:phosphate transport system substrate-binding protein
MSKTAGIAAVATLLTVSVLTPTGAWALDPALPAYSPVAGVSGRLKSVGSDTLNNEMALWVKAFTRLYPDVKIDVEGKGSSTAVPSLTDGSSQFGPMSRPMTAEEMTAFESKYGHKASSFRVAVDALAVYVHKDNPIRCLSLPQINQIFSSTRKVTGGNNAKTWGDVGLTGEWAAKPITLHGRNTISGTYAFFREQALYRGSFKDEVKEEAGSEDVVKAVANDKYAIGYSGIGYKTDAVRAVPVSSYFGAPCYDTSADSAYSGRYPIARYLYVYLNKRPNQQLDPLRAEFIRFVLSKDGQTQTEAGGYYPITNDIRENELRKLGLTALAN